ncbi:methyltransferase domain-containing protein [Amycolatopsis sp., V23-08]|uniref:Protein-L-isoaspartate O-methyltransferase n=1 Tax=Amycolatopsis heterodermiae TaxID=3110235 RepID=A0ABU5QXU1_9PSEU|nr:methyltransferase domain-containing protein [Amycolatopsis sp., V23-08]MEA5358753.1 methyltransferase domain-containing protein [Amycolatopsis sp., V23-08]
MTDATEQDRRLSQLSADLNHTLIERLATAGKLTEQAWRTAFEDVPRPLFAPRFTLPDNLGGHALDVADGPRREEWLRAVYQDEALLTIFDEREMATTSCSAPSVVAIMLEASQATEGDAVLEIGTGTGWTAGLLSHRLGSAAVTSVDIDPRCVAEAQERLDHLGLCPTLAVADGYLGYPAGGPYDRIIATASLRQVPPAWLGQVRPGGTILADLRGNFAGNLARLTVNKDGSARGRFLPERVNFMPLRSEEALADELPGLASRAVSAPGPHRSTGLGPAALRKWDFAFLAQLSMPGVRAGRIRSKGEPLYFCLTDPRSESWARIAVDASGGEREVTQGGDRRLWNELETTHELWTRLDQPRPEDFTIMVSPEGGQVVTLPGIDERWSLPL